MFLIINFKKKFKIFSKGTLSLRKWSLYRMAIGVIILSEKSENFTTKSHELFNCLYFIIFIDLLLLFQQM